MPHSNSQQASHINNAEASISQSFHGPLQLCHIDHLLYSDLNIYLQPIFPALSNLWHYFFLTI